MSKGRVKAPSQGLRQGAVLQQTSTISELYQGPIPHPQVLRQFDDLVPGSASEIIAMAQSEMQHRQSLEKESNNANIQAQQSQLKLTEDQSKYVFKIDLFGQFAGLVVNLVCIGAAVYLAVNNHEWVAGIIGGIPSASIARSFFFNRKSNP